ncbi:MAG TPA: hypothetical protein VGK44_11925 [Casimicrobiaceae bacterium]|jgi:hypothetical protein
MDDECDRVCDVVGVCYTIAGPGGNQQRNFDIRHDERGARNDATGGDTGELVRQHDRRRSKRL